MARLRRGVLLAAIAVGAAGCRDAGRVSISAEHGHELVLTVSVRDEAAAGSRAVTAFTVHVDGTATHDVLVIPGSGQGSYETLVGPLVAGLHTVEVKPSAHWPPHAGVRMIGLRARSVSPTEPDFDLLRMAPAIVLRPDTVGTSNDLPVLMYVEARRPGGGTGHSIRNQQDVGRELRYTTIFTNEDGGTETPALFARWGRACDIEETYAARIDGGGRVIEETYQGRDHKILPFKGSRFGDHPVLAVATRNNMFVDTAEAGVTIRPVPIAVEPGAGTREAVLDDRPWLQQLTALELAAEKKPFDPRDFVYLEARLELRDAAAVAWIEQPDGRRVRSDREDDRLSVTRNGWVRVAVPLARDLGVGSAGWFCVSRNGLIGACRIEPGRIFRLAEDFRIEPLGISVQAP
jgi:hypothetical protein